LPLRSLRRPDRPIGTQKIGSLEYTLQLNNAPS